MFLLLILNGIDSSWLSLTRPLDFCVFLLFNDPAECSNHTGSTDLLRFLEHSLCKQ